MSTFSSPKIYRKYCVIVNRDDHHLAALISSYLMEGDTYLPMFSFPEIEIFSNQEFDQTFNSELLAQTNANEIGIWIKNVLSILKECETVILGGLNEYQKSYLTVDINCIEVQSIQDLHLLEPLSVKQEYLECRIEDIYSGLTKAHRSNKYLVINEYSESLDDINQTDEKGVVVIENLENVSTIVAINYAHSIHALPVIIDKSSLSTNQVNEFISDWRDTGNTTHLNDLRAAIYPSIEHIIFKDFEFATFFTLGIPYSLIIENIIPCTHVNLILRPDFFVIHAIFAEERVPTFGAVMFSPEYFKNGETGSVEEETQFVVDSLENNFYHTKKVLGSIATCANLDYHVKAFPFDIFHICSHGGKVKGTPMIAEILDENGASHTCEYDFILTFASYPGIEKIGVFTLFFPRKIDGLVWRSPELRAKGFSNKFYDGIFEQLRHDRGKKNGKQVLIDQSFGVSCHDFVYVAQFNQISGFNSFPVIYNNSCWSWGEISKAFLNSGARMYIGNLWNIDNDVAISIAKNFYNQIFKMSIVEAFHMSIQTFKGASDYNVSMIWGVHFSTMKNAESVESSKYQVAARLSKSYFEWEEHIKSVSNPQTIDQISNIMQWIEIQIENNYQNEFVKLKEQFKQKPD